MNMIYNSPQFCVVEHGEPCIGFEIMDKSYRREIFLRGEPADRFRDGVSKMMQEERSLDEVDEFLSGYAEAMTQPLTLH